MLATSGLHRSISTAVYLTLATILFLTVSMFLEGVGTIALTPLLIFLRDRQRRYSVASRVMEASAWSRIIILVMAIILIILLGYASLYYSPLRTLWSVPPSPITICIVVVTASLVLISLVTENGYLNKLFALVEQDKKSGVITIYDENGEVTLKYKKVRVQSVVENHD